MAEWWSIEVFSAADAQWEEFRALPAVRAALELEEPREKLGIRLARKLRYNADQIDRLLTALSPEPPASPGTDVPGTEVPGTEPVSRDIAAFDRSGS